MTRIVIFANGELADASRALSLLRPTDMVVCADGGTRQALSLGVQPQMIIGDLDSMTEEEHKTVLALGVPVEQHPRDKDETDLELALRYARERDPSGILVVAALGRRLDQTLGNIALLTGPEWGNMDVRLDDGLEEVLFCRKQLEVHGVPGDLLSLIPWGGAARGVRTEGLRWPLHGETLQADRTRGISNEMLQPLAHVSVSDGLLLVIHRRQA